MLFSTDDRGGRGVSTILEGAEPMISVRRFSFVLSALLITAASAWTFGALPRVLEAAQSACEEECPRWTGAKCEGVCDPAVGICCVPE